MADSSDAGPAGERRAPDAQAPGALTYDAVVATRNRPEALNLSLPLLLSQSRPPARLILADSSDDLTPAPRAAQAAVEAAGWRGELILLRCRPGLPHQRNRGLAEVTAPVVFFPDDDSLLHPGTAEAIMQVYERDRESRVAGVCPADAHTPPGGVLPPSAYEMTAGQKRERAIAYWRNRMDRRIAGLNPFIFMGERLAARAGTPDWLAEFDAIPVEFMTGYRMTFRTDAIRPEGFDETFQGYALFEDTDACFAAFRRGCLVGALRGSIHHHKFPARRGSGLEIGAMQVLNRAYVALKHAHDGGFPAAEREEIRRRLRAFMRWKLAAGVPDLRTAWGRDRMRGTLMAMRELRALVAAPREELSPRYGEISARIAARAKGLPAPAAPGRARA